MKEESKAWKVLVLGVVGILLGYLEWCLLTIAYKSDLMYGIAFAVTIILWLLYCKMYGVTATYKKEYGQIRLVNIIFGLCNLMILFFSLLRQSDDWNAWIGAIHVGWIVICLKLFLWNKEKYSLNVWGKWMKNLPFKKQIAELLTLCVVIVGLCIDRDMLQFKWDGLLYYKTCGDLSLYSISKLAVYGHIAHTYGSLVRMADLVVGDTAIAMIIMNIILLLCGMISLYKILTHVLIKQNRIVHLLGTLLFAFSPFCLGMVNYHNLDFYLQCIFPIVIYFTLTKQWIFQFVAATLFCFTKEPAVIIYGGFCLGIVFMDLFKVQDEVWIDKIKRILTTKHYYTMALPGGVWIITYMLLGPWSAGEAGVTLDIAYIIEKLKVLYVLNFNWLLFLIILIGFLKFIMRRQKNVEGAEVIVPLVASQILFTVFSCCFKTVNHPRYSDSNVVTLSILAIIAICYLFHKSQVYIVMGLLTVLMFVSVFWTVDPISKKAFTVVNIGNTEMISTSPRFPGDGMIYNKQMLWLENVMNQAFADILKDGSCAFLPTLANSTYFFDGMAEVSTIEDGYQVDVYYWDNGRRTYYGDSTMPTINCIQITESTDFGMLKEKIGTNQADFLYLDMNGNRELESILSKYTMIEQKTYQYKGWKLNRVKIQL